MTSNIYILFFNIFLMLIYGAMNIFKNIYLDRGNLFGNRVEALFSDEEIGSYRHAYIKEASLVGIVSLLLLASIPYFLGNRVLFILSLLFFIGVNYLIYIRWNIIVGKNKKLKKLNKTNRSEEFKLGLVSAWNFIMPILIVLFNFILGIILYKKLPNKLPTSWDISGNISGQMDKSLKGVFLMPLFQLGILVFIFSIYIYLKRSKNYTNPNNPEESVVKNLIYRRVWSYYLLVSLVLTEILLTILNLMTLGLFDDMKLFNMVNSIVIGIILMGGVMLILVLGHGGDNLRIDMTFNTDREQKFWKLGNTIYINSRNPSIFVKRPYRNSLALNIARPMGMVLSFYPIVIIIVSLLINNP